MSGLGMGVMGNRDGSSRTIPGWIVMFAEAVVMDRISRLWIIMRMNGKEGKMRSNRERTKRLRGTSEANILSSTVNFENSELNDHLVEGHGIGRGSIPSVKGMVEQNSN